MSEELKPCPFCGGQAYYTESVNGNLMVYVGCGPCGIHFKAQRQDYGPTPGDLTKDIVTAWNTRNDRAVIDGFLARADERERIIIERAEATLDVFAYMRDLRKRATDEVHAEMFGKEEL